MATTTGQRQSCVDTNEECVAAVAPKAVVTRQVGGELPQNEEIAAGKPSPVTHSFLLTGGTMDTMWSQLQEMSNTLIEIIALVPNVIARNGEPCVEVWDVIDVTRYDNENDYDDMVIARDSSPETAVNTAYHILMPTTTVDTEP